MSDIIQSTTQQFLDIYDITNNFVLMKDGTVSTIITVDAMNFGLLAEEEQDAIMYAYAGLLNSLNYTVQIIIHSQTKDVTTYLKLLQEQESVAETETMRRRIKMYREFVGNLIHERNVLDKKFYVVIPASALEMGLLSTQSVLPGKTTFDITSVERSLLIEKAKNLLDPKRDHMIAQFGRIGLFSRQLTTQEIIQLFYIRYNPEAAEGQQIGESNSYTTPLVKASIQGNFMNTLSSVPTQPLAVSTPPANTATFPTEPAENALADDHVAPLEEIHIEPAVTIPPAVPQAEKLVMEDSPTIPVSTLPLAETPLPPTPHIPDAAPVAFTPPVPEISVSAPVVQTEQLITPVIEPITAITPVSPVSSTISSVPPLATSTIETVASTPPAVAPLTLTANPDEAVLKSDLDSALQAIGGSTSSDPTSSAPGGDLPPLPEI